MPLKTKTLDHGASTAMSVCKLPGCDDHVHLEQVISVEHLLKETNASLLGWSQCFCYMEQKHLWSRYLTCGEGKGCEFVSEAAGIETFLVPGDDQV